MSVTLLELAPSVGIEPAFIRDGSGHEVPNPNAGELGPLDAVGFSDYGIRPSASSVAAEGSNESRIIPGTRRVETNSPSVVARLLANGDFVLAGEESESLFPDEALFPDELLFPH